jgi:protein O-mannosyl-transferase
MRRPVTQAKPAAPRAASPVRVRPGLPAWLMAVLLVLVTMALYWPATRCDFVTYDDYMYVSDNPHVTSGLTLENARWAFGSDYAANWHPITWLSHMLDCQMVGLNAWGHHLSSGLLHALNAALVFALLQRMTGAAWRSLLVAALFALHPLRVESVAWVSERKDVLSGFFGLLALMAYARYAEARSLKSKVQSLKPEAGTEDAESGMSKPATRNMHHATRITHHVLRLTPQACAFYLLSLFCFALGLMSKPMLVTWPCVMLLLDYWPLRRLDLSTLHTARSTLLRLVREKTPFFVLAVAASVVTFVVQQRGGAVAAVESLPLGARVGNALISYGRYLGKLFWPTELAVYYPHPGHWSLGKMVLAGGLILGFSVLFFMQRRRAPYLLMGWLWFLGALVPVIGLVQVGEQAMADRYSYLPLLGVLIFSVWGACELSWRWRYQVLALSGAGGAAIVLCLALTRQQIGYWQDGETLFRHALEVTENNCMAHNNLGIALALKGQIDEALRQYQAAIRLKSDNAEAHYNLGLALDLKGQIDEAMRQFQEALRLKPDYADAHNNFGLALERKGQTDEAIGQFQTALRLKPDHAEAHNNLGIAFYQQRRTGEAIRQFQEALRLKPDFPRARKNLDVVLATGARPSPPPGGATSP